VGLQFDLDAFGGKIRGNVSHEWRSQHSKLEDLPAAPATSLWRKRQTRSGSPTAWTVDSRRQLHLSWKSRRAGPHNCVALERTDRAYLAHSHGRSNLLGAAVYIVRFSSNNSIFDRKQSVYFKRRGNIPYDFIWLATRICANKSREVAKLI